MSRSYRKSLYALLSSFLLIVSLCTHAASNLAEIGTAIDQLREKLRSAEAELNNRNNRWEKVSTKARAEIDEQTINQLAGFGHSDVIAAFTDKLNKNEEKVS
ncbi:MAG: hypothetical protein MI784_06035, partial [Cytophagales bacterium]|nr:hypothetical protein [Cytophagales bacterium]